PIGLRGTPAGGARSRETGATARARRSTGPADGGTGRRPRRARPAIAAATGGSRPSSTSTRPPPGHRARSRDNGEDRAEGEEAASVVRLESLDSLAPLMTPRIPRSSSGVLPPSA